MKAVVVLVLVAVVGLAGEALSAARWRVLRRRVERCVPRVSAATAGGGRRDSAAATVRRWLGRSTGDRPLAVLLGLAVWALVGGWAGPPVGLLAGGAAWRLLPRVRAPDQRRRAAEHEWLVRQLPLAAELLAACFGSNGSPAEAVAAVADSVPPPMRDRLSQVAARLALGAGPERCWGQLADECQPLAPLARCLARTSLSGAPPAAALTGLAQSQRAAAARAAHARVRRAGVLATAPLGLCFLPAFVLIGVVPVVTGLTAAFSQRL
ncbi:type II secretion system F family protein [Kitasatospora sp. NA04385]|uniref:type II secretion system F family protein n=1 Tax=Kitasatospora sp. NA04385 TaxID=2742135 RepID=UPI001C37D7EC|nr:type II secretion system F family protein [Kitasatospora sp. NA04385]